MKKKIVRATNKSRSLRDDNKKATATADPYGMTTRKATATADPCGEDNKKSNGNTGSLLISILLSCFDEGLGFFEEGEVFFVVCGFAVFDDDPLFHGSFAHGQESDIVSF